MEKSVVISGEASETDSDEEIVNPTKNLQNLAKSVQGSVITGEDSESEDENVVSTGSATSALNQAQILQETRSLDAQSRHNTLLHRKLRECNIQLYSDVENFCNDTVSDARKTIMLTDQTLLKSQISLQGALSAIKSLNVNSALVKNKLQSVLSAKFIPKINVPDISQKSRFP